jgi:hypothetical protein
MAEAIGRMKLLNAQDFAQMLKELEPKQQNKVVMQGFRLAGKIINDQAKTNFRAVQKDKSKDNYRGFASMFKTKVMRNKVGVVVGVQDKKKGYIYRFLDNNEGQVREYKSRRGNSGVLPATHFFEKAVEAKQGQAEATIEENVILAMEKTVAKYNKRYSI